MRINYKIDWKALGTMQGSHMLSAKKYLILEAALKILARDGIHELSITEISKVTELSKPLVIYHYDRIDRMLEDIYFYLFKMGEYFISSSLKEEQSFEIKIRQMCSAYFRWYLFNKEVSEALSLFPHLKNTTKTLKNYDKNLEIFLNREWERIFLESLRYRSMEELRIAVFGVRSLILGTLTSLITSKERTYYNEPAMRLQFNLETLLKVELPSFDF